jgi:hypothetical protein
MAMFRPSTGSRVAAGLVKQPDDWPYSNYLEWVGKRQGSIIDREFAEAVYGDPIEYEAFVHGSIDEALEAKLAEYYLD